MIEYRKARPDEREACIELANLAFQFDLEAQLPKVYGKDSSFTSLHKVAADEHGKLRAQVAVLPQRLHVGDHSLRAGFVGIVSVHPEARGEGHMKALMNEWLDEMRDSYDMAVLWGQRQRYEYFGFTQGGVQFKYWIGEANVRHALRETNAERLSFRPLFEVDGADSFAHALNASRPAYVRREDESLPDYFKTLKQVAIGVLDDDKLIGYVIANDKGDEISEFAIEDQSDITRTIKAYMKHAGADRISILVPEYDTALNAILGGFAEIYTIETVNMYRIFDYANVMQAYLTLKHRTIGLAHGVFSAVLDGQPVTVRSDENGVTVERSALAGAVTLDQRQAQTLLLSRHGVYLPVSAPAGWFPLQLFWYTADLF
ncbi:GNAT family N-acetyltransferase [Cohnella sp. GCM10027633]|uniref:GNAT family N-acetyltransferase n=1 Tax=unclassified Cohnella TaxID=2636738 RepID=UPI0036400085